MYFNACVRATFGVSGCAVDIIKESNFSSKSWHERRMKGADESALMGACVSTGLSSLADKIKNAYAAQISRPIEHR